MNIPSMMQHIWIGPNPAPLKWMNTWKELHPHWDYTVFGNSDLNNTTFHNQHLIDEYYQREKYNGVADLIRYELLYKHGGFIPPADAICLSNTDELWEEPTDVCYTVYEHEILRPGYVSPIYACNPGNQFVKLIINTLHQLKPEDLSNQVWTSTGNLFLCNLINTHPPGIKIFPSYYFIPKHFKDKYPATPPGKVYADQMWGSTRKRYQEGEL
jgi:mannosyltransferase OCH1-like enzyme